MSYFKAIFGKTSDSTYQVPRIDVATHCLTTIDYAHHEVHAGSSYYYHDVVQIANGGTLEYIITTPNTTSWAHFGFEANFTDGAGTIEIYEAGDRNGTTLQTVFNRDRNSLNVAAVTVHKAQTGGTTDGTRIAWKRSGSGKVISGIAGTNEERILKQNTKYLVRITNNAGATNWTTVIFRWYEHTNKTA
jgi:hypothetical protein